MANRDSALAAELLDSVRAQWQLCLDRIWHCVGQLSDEQLWHRHGDDFNSIGNLLLHLTGNVRERMLSVVGGEPGDRDRDAEFSERGPLPRNQILKPFEEVMRRTDELLASLPADRLLEMRRFRMLRGDVDARVLTVILQTLVHLSGHSQEIVSLTRRELGDAYRFLQSPPKRLPAIGSSDNSV
jgi:uncharacterized damage-inducible protein DinB